MYEMYSPQIARKKDCCIVCKQSVNKCTKCTLIGAAMNNVSFIVTNIDTHNFNGVNNMPSNFVSSITRTSDVQTSIEFLSDPGNVFVTDIVVVW